MYESPIEVFQQTFNKMETRREDNVVKAVLTEVHRVGVNVDKEELEKALRYDRDQYNKGYEDAKRKFSRAISDLATQTPFHGGIRYDEYTDCWITPSGDRYRYYHCVMLPEEQFNEMKEKGETG